MQKVTEQEQILDNVNEVQWALDEIVMCIDDSVDSVHNLDSNFKEIFLDSVSKIKMVRDQLVPSPIEY